MGDCLHRLSPAILIGYVDVAKSVGTQKGAIRLRIRGRYHPTLTSPIVDLDQGVGSWTANMEETLEVGGSRALAGQRALEHRTWAKFFARICETSVDPASATILDSQDDLSSAS